MAIENVIKNIDENRQRFIDEMASLVRVASVSSDSARREDTRKCASLMVQHLQAIGVKKAHMVETGGYPAVCGELMNDPKMPTFLVYGHYDVQPASKEDGWDTDPFEPIVIGDYIYGRGVADDKGKLLIPLKAIGAFTNTKTPLKPNFKFFIEGEEECGSDHTAEFVVKNREKLACDAVIIFDSPWILPDFPSITYSLRGICYWQVDLEGPNRDLHSGIYGGKVQNPLNAAARIIARLHDDKGRVLIPGFYDDVVPLAKEERETFAKLPFKEEDILNDIRVDALWGEEGYTAIERNWARPALDVNGIWGGYQGEGSKTVIPAQAHFKVSARIVAEQDPKKIDAAFHEYIKKICPPGVRAKVTTMQAVAPSMTPINNRFLHDMEAAIEKAFGKKPALIRNGASIPISATFKDVLNAPSLLFDVNIPNENIHGPNEKLDLDAFHAGIKAAAYFYDMVGKGC